MDRLLARLEVAPEQFHDLNKDPKGFHQIALHNVQNWRRYVGHSLQIANVKVVHHISHEQIG